MRWLVKQLRRWHCLTALSAWALFQSTGCVERLLQVRSTPSGANVYVNGDEVGKTPCDHPFSFYGTVDITLRSPGHLSHRELNTLSPPWYELFPLDFFSDLILPFTLRDVHPVEVVLVPSPSQMDESQQKELDKKAEELSSQLPSEKAPKEEKRGK